MNEQLVIYVRREQHSIQTRQLLQKSPSDECALKFPSTQVVNFPRHSSLSIIEFCVTGNLITLLSIFCSEYKNTNVCQAAVKQVYRGADRGAKVNI